MFPWDFKILYGIIADTVRLPCIPSAYKAPRRAYLMLFAFIQFCVLLTSGLV